MPDVNVLVYAHRQDEAVHEGARSWVDAAVNGSEPFALSMLVTTGFVRVVTNPRIYPQPTPIGLALATIDAMLSRPNCRICRPGTRHWELFSRLCRDTQASGKLVADAQHAAIAIEHGCEWVSRDGDFERFERSGLRWTHLRF
ncbi:MAG: type II toxin-antitoxin system VapC family toxin [bacterium]